MAITTMDRFLHRTHSFSLVGTVVHGQVDKAIIPEEEAKITIQIAEISINPGNHSNLVSSSFCRQQGAPGGVCAASSCSFPAQTQLAGAGCSSCVKRK